jgi:hypothetical protein
MLLEEIKHTRTLQNIIILNIDVSQFPDLHTLRKFIHREKLKQYSKTHREYFRDKMRKQLENDNFRALQYERVRIHQEKKKSQSPPKKRGRPRIIKSSSDEEKK